MLRLSCLCLLMQPILMFERQWDLHHMHLKKMHWSGKLDPSLEARYLGSGIESLNNIHLDTWNWFNCDLLDSVLLFLILSGVYVKSRVSPSQYNRRGSSSWEKSSYTCEIRDTIFHCFWNSGMLTWTWFSSILNIIRLSFHH